MRLCRYDDDRLGVVRGNMVHDVTEAQTKIRAAAPYAMKGDAVIAALPEWRARLEEMAAKAPGKPVSAGQAAVAGGAAFQARRGAHQLQGAYRGNGGAGGNAEHHAVAGHRHRRTLHQGELVPGRPVRGRGDPLPRAPQRA